jgi:ferritin
MLITAKINAAINEQIGSEFAASLQYVAIAAYFGADGLERLQARFLAQAAEERDHALKFLQFVLDAGGKVEIPALPAPRSAFKNVEDAVRASLDWENTVTQQVYRLMDLAVKESNYITQNFLGWFLTEQLEEVSSMENLLKLVQRLGEKNLVYLESHLAREASRPAPPPQPTST